MRVYKAVAAVASPATLMVAALAGAAEDQGCCSGQYSAGSCLQEASTRWDGGRYIVTFKLPDKARTVNCTTNPTEGCYRRLMKRWCKRKSAAAWVGLFACGALLCTACGEAGDTTSSNVATANSTGDVELLTGSFAIALQTSFGDIELELDANAAPLAATNFVLHTRSGYYDGLTFHRVIPGFMIQGGDPAGSGSGGQSVFGTPFEDEINSLSMDRGVIAMANSGANTNGSQFFIVQAEDGTPFLLGKHTVFGRVTSGMDVVDAIATAPTNASARPLSPITMTPVEQQTAP